MGRYKVRPFNAHIPVQQSTSSAFTPARLLNKRSPLTSAPLTSSPILSQGRAAGRERRLSRSIRRLVTGLAGLNWIATIPGYYVMTHTPASLDGKWAVIDGLKLAVCLTSALQSVLIICYWRVYWAYLETLRRALHLKWKSEPALQATPSRLLICLSEFLFHLISFLPTLRSSSDFPLFGAKAGLTMDELCCIVIVIAIITLFACYIGSRSSQL